MKATLTAFGAVPTVWIWYGASAKSGFVQPAVAQFPGVVLDDVRRDVRVGGLGGPVGQVHLAPVELVVAEGRHVVAHRVVDRDRRVPLAGRRPVAEVGEQAALHLVAGIHQQDVGRADGRANAVHDRGDPGRRPGCWRSRGLQLAVEVVRVQDRERDRAGRGGARGRRDAPRPAAPRRQAAGSAGNVSRGHLRGEGTRGRTWPALSADQHKGTDGTLAPLATRRARPNGSRIHPDRHLRIAGRLVRGASHAPAKLAR